MMMTPAVGRAEGEYCGAFPGLSAAGARVPCTVGECPTERICRALRGLDREAAQVRADRDAAARLVDDLLDGAGAGPGTRSTPGPGRDVGPGPSSIPGTGTGTSSGTGSPSGAGGARGE